MRVGSRTTAANEANRRLESGDKPTFLDRSSEEIVTLEFFASLFGSSPVEASSGKDVRRRLNRGGNFEVAVRRTATPWSALWSMSTV